MVLKHTQVELDPITDKDAYLIIENFIRGGIATISKKYVRANNPLVVRVWLRVMFPRNPPVKLRYILVRCGRDVRITLVENRAVD